MVRLIIAPGHVVGHRREFVPPPDWGFGAHIREAVAIIRDWVRNPWRPAP